MCIAIGRKSTADSAGLESRERRLHGRIEGAKASPVSDEPLRAQMGIAADSEEGRLWASSVTHLATGQADEHALDEDSLVLGVSWSSLDPITGCVTSGRLAFLGPRVLPRHSALNPYLLNILSSSKAAARTMYAETSRKQQRIIADALTGVDAIEDNPLVVDVTYDYETATSTA